MCTEAKWCMSVSDGVLEPVWIRRSLSFRLRATTSLAVKDSNKDRQAAISPSCWAITPKHTHTLASYRLALSNPQNYMKLQRIPSVPALSHTAKCSHQQEKNVHLQRVGRNLCWLFKNQVHCYQKSEKKKRCGGLQKTVQHKVLVLLHQHVKEQAQTRHKN